MWEVRQTKKETELFELAFELAYFIHANREIAFFIAEDALDELGSVVGYQKKNRAPSERLQGFWKWGERTRPVRKTLILDEYQMVQWLVYKQSEYWELQTEEGKGFYAPSEEDLLVRYIKHLVFLTTRRGSFYVTLSICSILHQLDRRESRLFYDVLTQSDAARMKDTSYIGKQRIDLLEKVFRRFKKMVVLPNKAGSEKQFLTQPPTQISMNLINESLRRFTPWGTTCVLERRFDVTDIPELYFSANPANEDEENRIEMNRIHIVLHPECLAQFTNELASYVRSLPHEDLDASCNFDSLDQRIALPQFVNLRDRPPRDRFQSPQLRAEDYVRLRRTLDARGHRKQAFVPQTLCVYGDDLALYTFDAKSGKGQCFIAPETSLIEVRGRDIMGEVTLATLPLSEMQLPTEGFADSIVHPGGQTVSVRLSPTANGEASAPVQLKIGYRQNGHRVFDTSHYVSGHLKRLYYLVTSGMQGVPASDLPRIGIAIVIVAVSVLIGWWLLLKPEVNQKASDEIAKHLPKEDFAQRKEQAGERRPAETQLETPNSRPRNPDVTGQPARAHWTKDRNAALRAITVEPTRSETQPLDFSTRQNNFTISLPVYDGEGRLYLRYRLTLLSGDRDFWRRTLEAPKFSATGYTHILEIVLFTRRLPKGAVSGFLIEGFTAGDWHPVGKLAFIPR